MRFSGSLAALVATAALSLATPQPVRAGPDAEPAEPVTEQAAAPAGPEAPGTDAERYAEREGQDPSAAEFKGGDSVLILGSTAAIVLLVVLLVVLL